MRPPGAPLLRALLAASLMANAILAARVLSARDHPLPEGMREYRRARAEHLASLETRGAELVLVGDSLTDRGEWGELLGPGVLNRGIASDRVRDATARAAEIGRREPKRIAVLLGINDLLRGATSDEIVHDYEALLTALAREAPRARLFVQSVLPVRAIDDAKRVRPDDVRALNARLAALAAQRGSVFVDLAPRFAGDGGELAPELTTDGVHLTAGGYRLWRDALRLEILGGPL